MNSSIASTVDIGLDRILIQTIDKFMEEVKPVLGAQIDPDYTAIEDPDFHRESLQEMIAAERLSLQADKKNSSPINLAQNPINKLNEQSASEEDDEGTVIIPH